MERAGALQGNHRPGSNKRFRRGLLFSLAGLIASCQPLDHYILHSRQAPSSVSVWNEEAESNGLHIRLEWAKPSGAGPFPAVLVHPEAGKTAADMRGVLNDLAAQGYLAAAADYRRAVNGELRLLMFPWRSDADAVFAFGRLRSRPETDPERIGLIGFSQGAVFSLIIGTQFKAGVKAVAAYYPMTDLVGLLGDAGGGPFWERIMRDRIRSTFREQVGVKSDEDFNAAVRHASPLEQAENLTAPVLFIHGERDAVAPIGESIKLYERLKELGRETELLAVPEAVHAFNFRNRAQAAAAWDATLAWFDRHLKQGPAPKGDSR